MPVFNGEAFLDRAIQSLLNQEFHNFRLIIADNCSTDKTALICKKYSQEDNRIEYFRHNKNEGPFYNFQFVFDKATTEYFMWASHDDYWFPGFIQELVSILEANDDCIIAFPVARYVDEEGYILKQNPCLNKSLQPVYSEKNNKKLLHNISFYKFLFAEMSSGKLDLFYGLFRKKELNGSNFVAKWKDILWGNDSLIIAEILMYGNAYFIDKPLMDKMVRRDSAGVKIDKTKSLSTIIRDTLSTLYDINIWAIKGHNRLFKVKSRFKISRTTSFLYISYEVLRSNLRMFKLILIGIFNRILVKK
jgi:glycosyltransferase involved in cell wall biosynthesis|tara:strand:+ start:927 stop:1838 length:912 start_codon:yes stop_codon:yes gene_type:complete